MNRLTIAAIALGAAVLGAAVLVVGGTAFTLRGGGDGASADTLDAQVQASSGPAASSGARAQYLEAAGYPRPVLFRNGLDT